MAADRSHRLQLVIEPELREQIKAVAAANRRSVSAECCCAIEAWVKQHLGEGLPASGEMG